MKVTRIHIQDHGQDFLWWDVNEDGDVVDCGPFQASVWVGSELRLPVELLEPGDPINFVSPNGEFMTLNYAIEKIEIKEVNHG